MATPRRQGYGWWALLMSMGLAFAPASLALMSDAEEPRAVDLLPLQAREQAFRITEGKAAGTATKLVTEQARGAAGEQWRLALDGFNETLLQQMPDGSIAISEITLHTKNQRIVFAEPVPLLPARMSPGQVERAQTTAYIYDAKTGDLDHSGPVEHQLTSRGPTRFDLAGGAAHGFEIEMRQDVDLSLADVDLNLTAGFVPGEGMVRRRIALTVKKLGLFGDTNVTVSELDEPLPEQPAL